MGGGLVFRRGEIKKEYARKAEEREIEFRRLEKRKRDARVKKQPRYDAITKDVLLDLYTVQKKSIREIAALLGFSVHKISYWLLKYDIAVRNIRDAVSVKKNSHKNHQITQFVASKIHNTEFLLGIGCGAYWSGGMMSEKVSSFQLSSEDPKLLRMCISFIARAFGVKKSEIRVRIRIKEGGNVHGAFEYWMRELEIPRSQFQKKIVTFRSSGMSEKRNVKYGIVTIQVHDEKLRKFFQEIKRNIYF